MNYLLEIPYELYNIIASFLEFNELLIMHTIKKHNYKMLLQFNYPDLYSKIMFLRNIDYNLNKYSIKNLYYSILDLIKYSTYDFNIYLNNIDKYYIIIATNTLRKSDIHDHIKSYIMYKNGQI